MKYGIEKNGDVTVINAAVDDDEQPIYFDFFK